MTQNAATTDELLLRLRRFKSDYFPLHQQRFQDLVAEGQHPKTLFIGCSDSRLVPSLLTGAGPGELSVSNLTLDSGVYDDTLQKSEQARYQAILDAGLRKLNDAGLTAFGEVVIGDAVTEITRCADSIGADLIVVGHKHRSGWAARWWSGSVSKALIEHAPCRRG